MEFDRQHDARVRAAAFDWISSQVSIHGDVLPRSILSNGFEFERRRVPLVAQAMPVWRRARRWWDQDALIRRRTSCDRTLYGAWTLRAEEGGRYSFFVA